MDEKKPTDTNQSETETPENTSSAQKGQASQEVSSMPLSPTENTSANVSSEITPAETIPKSEMASLPAASDASPLPPPLVVPSQKKDRFFPVIIILVLLFVGILVVAAWYFQTQLQKSTSQTAMSSASSSATTLPKQIVVGTDPTFQPMEYMDKGKLVGYDIDLTNLLTKQLNVKVIFKNITFDNLFSALKQHQIDMIISAVTITPERQKQYAFSEAYLNAGQVIITQKTNTTIKSPKQLMGKKIGVQQGTTDEQEAMKYTTSNFVIKYADFEKATTALVAGDVDAIITDLPSAQGIVSSNSTLKIASDPFTNDYYGIVLRKGDPNVQAVNKALDQLRVRGYLTELKSKWLD